jgi:hypothetical protein
MCSGGNSGDEEQVENQQRARADKRAGLAIKKGGRAPQQPRTLWTLNSPVALNR